MNTIKLDYIARAIDPIAHSSGTDGNESILRTEDILDSRGRRISIPLGISANACAHCMLREPGALFMLDALQLKEMDEEVVHLLFSGGPKMSKKAKWTLEDARAMARLVPIVSVMGYSAGNVMQASKVEIRDLRPIARENLFRTPKHILERLPEGYLIDDADTLRDVRMLTRRNALGSPAATKLLSSAAQEKVEAASKAKKGAKSAKEAKGDSTQMIAQTQCFIPGTMFYGSMIFRDLSELEVMAVQSALSTASIGMIGDAFLIPLGGKRNRGMGTLAFQFFGSIAGSVTHPEWEETDTMAIDKKKEWWDALKDHYQENRDKIVETLRRVYE